jgi:hypothetical protein
MSNVNSFEDTISRLASQSDAVGRLAQDSGAFAAVVAAFESADANALRWVLDRLEMLPYCELICEWVRIKLCAQRCIVICGAPREKAKLPNLQQFARAIATLSSNEKLLRRVVDAISCGDRDAYHAALEELKLIDFCNLFCHWICSTGYRRVCETVCRVGAIPILDPVNEIRAAGKFLATVIANEKAFDAIHKAAADTDSERLRAAINQFGFAPGCEIICHLICTHRCVLVCRELCEVFPPILVSGAAAIEEAQHFALASRQLASQPRLLSDLVTSVQEGNVELYREIVGRFGLGPYCWQICAWVCSVSCHEFCVSICPPPVLDPIFTSVGHFSILSHISGTSGKTNMNLSFSGLDFGGGPNFAFYQQLELRGFCPIDSPIAPGVQMKYRFLYDGGSGPLPITGSLVSKVQAGSRYVFWPTNSGGTASLPMVATIQPVSIVAAPAPLDPIPPAFGSPWVGPTEHCIPVDDNGWVVVDPDAVGGGFTTLIGFDTTQPQIAPGVDPLPGVPAGTAVPVASQRAGKDFAIIFEGTRVTTLPAATPDFTNKLNKIHINNWSEVNELAFAEFGTDCCTPIDANLSVQFTVDHEEMDSGVWSLAITSCSLSAPNNITPTVSGPGVTVTPRGGSGTIVEDTSSWSDCSYTGNLAARAGLTTGLLDNQGINKPLTFCICGH